MRLTIVEPDAALGLFLKKGLTAEGHEVSWTDSHETALELAETGALDLMVLDASAPLGKTLVTTLQRLSPRTSVLCLLRRDSVEDRVECLDLGADDCMAKPFSFHELTARCRALLRRQSRVTEGEILLTHGDLTLNRISRSTSVGGRAVSLTAKEFRLLEFLLQNAGRCCSRSELLTEVFQLPADNATNVVDVYINYLRKKLSSTVGESSRIVTVRGAGYRLSQIERINVPFAVPDLNRMHASA